jgi:hypothetical protein
MELSRHLPRKAEETKKNLCQYSRSLGGPNIKNEEGRPQRARQMHTVSEYARGLGVRTDLFLNVNIHVLHPWK